LLDSGSNSGLSQFMTMDSANATTRDVPLTFAEEIMLLLLDERSGKFIFVPQHSMNFVLSGAILMDLAILGKIDTDLEKLIVIDASPTGDDLLDQTLARLTMADEQHDARYWVEFCQRDSKFVRQQALDRLCETGILELQENRVMWVFRSHRYPIRDGKAEKQVKLRIMSILFSDEIPEPRDIAIIGLVDVCGIFRHLLSAREHDGARERIAQIRKMDLIGQAVTNCVREIELQLAQSMAVAPM